MATSLHSDAKSPPKQPPRKRASKSAVSKAAAAPAAARVVAEKLPPPPDSQARQIMIAKAAYLRAEKRGFSPGGELVDWLAAEAEVNDALGAALEAAT